MQKRVSVCEKKERQIEGERERERKKEGHKD